VAVIRKACLVMVLGCLAAAAFAAGPTLPVERVVIPPKSPVQLGQNLGKKGSPNVGWLFNGAPADGLDAVRATISPRAYFNPGKNFIYWAFDSVFVHGETYYAGLQPNGEFGKTALFSVFGPETSSKSKACKVGADYGAGTSCHIHYDWQLEHSYQFTVALVGTAGRTTTWEGAVVDVATGVRTVIGDITVGVSRGYLAPWALTFVEYFRHIDSCAEEPFSEVLFFRPVGYRNGKEYKATLHSMNLNTGCGQIFYGDGRNYVYVDVGQR
jgi:hypothetical protein